MKRNLPFAMICFFAVATQSMAQTKFVASRIENRSAISLNSHFKNYSLFQINSDAIDAFTQQRKGTYADFELQLPGLADWKLSVSENNLISKDYVATAGIGSGMIRLAKITCRTYSGYVSGDDNSRVSLTIDNNFVYGMIKSQDKEYFIEPLTYFSRQAPAGIFVVYDTKEVVADPNISCGVTETRERANIMARTDAGTNCVRTEMAIASDFSMFTRYGSAANVQNHNIGVMNNVIWDYVNNQFTDNIEFAIVTQNVSTSAGTDQVTTTTNSNTVLSDFRTWGQGGGFGAFTYDIGQLWTTRDLDDNGAGNNSGIIGLAYVGTVCSSFRYQILEDFTGSNPSGSGYQLRVLTSHETGHNFGCSHDASGDPYIMAPSVGITNTWSPASVSTVNANVPGFACLASCVTAAPVAGFITSPEGICTGGTIQLTDHSLNGPTSWSWTMAGGTPSSSTVRNPSVSYATPGIKTISFTSTNGIGTSSPYTKKVLISAAAATACSIPGGDNGSPAGIKGFSLNNINKVSGSATDDGNRYMDFSCSDVTSLAGSTTYSVTVNVGFFSATDPTPPHIFNHVRFYIDYNNDGDFADGGELVYTSGGTAFVGNQTFTFTTPTPIITDQFLRARIIAADFATAASPCHNPSAGQVEDYAVFFPSSVLLSFSRLDFEGSNRGSVNILDWKAYNEIGNNYFEMERSTDGISFSPIAKVNSRISGTNNYTFTDRFLNMSGFTMLYYRLKIVEISGSFTYSKVVPVTIKDPENKLLVNLLPNPFSSTITIIIHSGSSDKLKMQLIDIGGRVVYQDERTIPAGFNSIIYNGLEKLSGGTYLIKFTCNNETSTRLIQKQ